MAKENTKVEEKKKKKKKAAVDPVTQSLMTESDSAVMKISGVSMILFFILAVFLGTVELVVDDVNFEDEETADLTAVVQMEEKKEEKKKKKKEKAKKPRKKTGGGGKPRGKGNPKAPQTRGVLKLLTTKSSRSGYSAYNLMSNQKFAKDINKVLKNVAGLQTTGVTKLGGRRGSATGGFNDGYAEGGSGGIGDMLGGLLGGGSGSISTQARGKIKPPSARDIDMGSGNASRSAAEVMRVVRARTPGLRHVYNKFLKQKPGFSGKVTFQFTIAPGGNIISISVVSSTTGYSEFDNEIKKKIKRWKWNKIKSGNTTVKIPFSFSE